MVGGAYHKERNAHVHFSQNLKTVKERLRVWNIIVFNNIFEAKIILEREINKLNNKVIKNGMMQTKFETYNSHERM